MNTIVAETCNCWVTDSGALAFVGDAGHICNKPADRYLRIGDVVECTCRECYERDIPGRGARRSTERAYHDYLNSLEDGGDW